MRQAILTRSGYFVLGELNGELAKVFRRQKQEVVDDIEDCILQHVPIESVATGKVKVALFGASRYSNHWKIEWGVFSPAVKVPILVFSPA